MSGNCRPADRGSRGRERGRERVRVRFAGRRGFRGPLTLTPQGLRDGQPTPPYPRFAPLAQIAHASRTTLVATAHATAHAHAGRPARVRNSQTGPGWADLGQKQEDKPRRGCHACQHGPFNPGRMVRAGWPRQAQAMRLPGHQHQKALKEHCRTDEHGRDRSPSEGSGLPPRRCQTDDPRQEEKNQLSPEDVAPRSIEQGARIALHGQIGRA